MKTILIIFLSLALGGCDLLRDLGGGPDRQSPGGSQTKQEQLQ